MSHIDLVKKESSIAKALYIDGTLVKATDDLQFADIPEGTHWESFDEHWCDWGRGRPPQDFDDLNLS